jgi:hypothetical protein
MIKSHQRTNLNYPNSTLYWIDKWACSMMEHPDEFNRLLEEWLTKTKCTTSRHNNNYKENQYRRIYYQQFDVSKCPKTFTWIRFIGRSNVGKSSWSICWLIAKTSGVLKNTINKSLSINNNWFLVDFTRVRYASI